jgi:Bcr/CflA subfamily drug resistance transporter
MASPAKSPLRIIIILCLISSVGRFVIDSYLPSLPAIADNLKLATSSVQMTLTLYLLGFGVSQLIYGPLSDCFGRRKVMLVGLLIFLVGAIGCMLAPNSSILMFFRLLSGLGAGSCGVLNRAIASDCFQGADFSKAWSYTTTTLVLTLIFAPIIGGFIQQYSSWRANFLLSAIFVGAILAIIYFTLPETKNSNEKRSLDVKLIVKDYGKILSSSSFMIATLFYTLAFGGLIAYFQVSPLIFIDHFNLSPTQYGLSSVGIAFSYLAGGQIVRKYVHKIGVTPMLHIGIAILFVGGIAMLIACYVFESSWQAILFSAIIYVLGTRIVIPNSMSLAISSFKKSSGTTSAVIGSIQMLGAMVISGLLAHFSTQSALPLAWFLVAIGLTSLVLVGLRIRQASGLALAAS